MARSPARASRIIIICYLKAWLRLMMPSHFLVEGRKGIVVKYLPPFLMHLCAVYAVCRQASVVGWAEVAGLRWP